jgi:hypothetical protein
MYVRLLSYGNSHKFADVRYTVLISDNSHSMDVRYVSVKSTNYLHKFVDVGISIVYADCEHMISSCECKGCAVCPYPSIVFPLWSAECWRKPRANLHVVHSIDNNVAWIVIQHSNETGLECKRNSCSGSVNSRW